MRRKYKRWGLIPFGLPLLLVISAVLMLGITFGDYEIEKLGMPVLSKVAELIFLIAISYVVAYVFYYLTVQLKYDRELPQRRKYISKRLGKILDSGEFILAGLLANAEAKGEKIEAGAINEHIKTLSKSINPRSAFMTSGGEPTLDWVEAANVVYGAINEAKQEIILLSSDIDLDLVDLLDELTDSQINRFARLGAAKPVHDLSGWDFESFFRTLEKIKSYKQELDKPDKKKRKKNG